MSKSKKSVEFPRSRDSVALLAPAARFVDYPARSLARALAFLNYCQGLLGCEKITKCQNFYVNFYYINFCCFDAGTAGVQGNMPSLHAGDANRQNDVGARVRSSANQSAVSGQCPEAQCVPATVPATTSETSRKQGHAQSAAAVSQAGFPRLADNASYYRWLPRPALKLCDGFISHNMPSLVQQAACALIDRHDTALALRIWSCRSCRSSSMLTRPMSSPIYGAFTTHR